ncbi:MAG TPA: hypothetical protein VHY22_13150 [Chthoniobacteraceae bacterium]|nr:hypothetical protein [Chthoniobacteraceae bacterium]
MFLVLAGVAMGSGTQQQVVFAITDGTVQNGSSISGSSAALLPPAAAYSYSISGSCYATGYLADLISGTVSLADALDDISSGDSSYLEGTVANPGGTLPFTVLSKDFSGTFDFFIISGSVSAFFNVAVDGTGRASFSVTDVNFDIDGSPDSSSSLVITSATVTTTAVLSPVVTTGTATSVTGSSAVLNATVNPNGDDATVYFEYGTSSNSLGFSSSSTIVPLAITGTGVSIPLTGLSPGDTYYYAVYASNSTGPATGGTLSFRTQGEASPTAPTVSTDAASGVGTTVATLNGTVDANGLSTVASFNYGLTSTYGSVITAAQSPVTGTAATAVSGSLTGLQAGVQYHFQVSGSNSSGVTTGSDMVFTTVSSGSAPTFVTGSAGDVTTTGATLYGSADPSGYSTTVNFLYGTTGTFGSSIAATQSPVSGTASTAVSAQLSGLSPGQIYFYKVTGSSIAGSGTGFALTFITPASASEPTVLTGAADPVGITTATLNGTVNANGASTAVTFSYGLTGTYGTTVNATLPSIGGTAAVAVDAPITGLLPGTPYHFAVTGSNSQGVVTGSDEVFTTGSAVPPAVVTGSASSVTTTSVTLNGTVNPNGVSTTAFFQYGSSNLYGSATTSVSAGSGTSAAPVGIPLSGLQEGSPYHYRLVAANTSGTTYGDDQTFATPFLLTAIAGSYQAAITGTDAASSGLATVSLTKTGGFTTSLDLGGKTTKLTGKVSAVSGTGSVTTKSGLTFQLQAANTESGLSVTGSLGGSENLSFIADKEMTSSSASAFTVRLTQPADPSLPQGYGYAAMTLGKTGKIHLSGELGDGTGFTAGATLLSNDTWALYVPLYTKKQGCVVGTITMESSTNGVMDGAVTWIKPTTAGNYTPGSFATQVELYGSAYTKPLKGNPVISSTSGNVVIAGGGLPFTISGIPAELSTADKFTFPTLPTGISLKMSVAPANGLFSGSVSGVDPLTQKKVTETFHGAVYQGSLQFGAGVFKGPTEAGSVDFFEP